MPEYQKTTDSQTFGSASNEALKSRPHKKYVIIAVSAILVITIILAAILVGMHLFTEAQKDIVQFSYNRDKNTKEEVTSDPNANIVQYHVNSVDYEAWIINDFNRDIQVMKIHSELGTNCYLTPLNRIIADDPSKIKPPSGNNPTNTTYMYILNYRSARNPVSDQTFLGQTARSACNGISTYWLYPVCEASEKTSIRQKRKQVTVSVSWGVVRVKVTVKW